MPFINTLILLLALLLAGAGVPYFVGYGLSAHGGPWIPLGLACGALAALLVWIHLRLLGRSGSTH